MQDLIKNCKITCSTIGQAISLIDSDPNIEIIKIPNILQTQLFFDKERTKLLADVLTNFRTIDNKFIGHLDTKIGKIPVPIYFPNTSEIIKKYGVPYRTNLEILVDAYILKKSPTDTELQFILFKVRDNV